jgi:hypothetical protein
LITSSHKTRKVVLVLLTGVCLAANGSYAAESSTANSAQKPVSQAGASAHPATTHTMAKKPGTRTTVSHSASKRSASPHSGSAYSAASKTTSHASSASAVKRAPNHTTAYASQRKASPARSRYSANRRVSTLNGWQRLARLHLQPERVQEIQQALIREGYLQGEASGQWDARTRDAMLRYQTMHGFPVTGLPEAKSLMKLGLGSHPLPAELDHGAAGIASPGGAPGDFTVTPPSPPVSLVTPPS